MNIIKNFLVGLTFITIIVSIIAVLSMIAQKISMLIGSWLNVPYYEVYVGMWIIIGSIIITYVVGILVREWR